MNPEYKETCVRDYHNGAQTVHENGNLIYTHYNTGDQIWFTDGKVVAIITHDGIEWGEVPV